MNHDNIISIISRASIITKTSAKTGNPYTQLVLHYDNGKSKYEQSVFLSDEQKALIGMLLDGKKPSSDLLDD